MPDRSSRSSRPAARPARSLLIPFLLIAPLLLAVGILILTNNLVWFSSLAA